MGEPGVWMGDTAHLLEGKARSVTGPTANTHRSLPNPKRRAVPTALVTPHRASEILYWKIIAVYYIEDCSPLGHKESDTTE